LSYRLMPLAVALFVAACQPAGPPPPGSASSALAPDAVVAELASSLEARGFEVEATEDGLRASSSDAAFTRCLPVNVRDGSGDGRRVFTQVDTRQAIALVRAVPTAAGAEVSWSTSYAGRYRNRVDNTWFDRTCDGTGELERLLQSIVAG
jgi:hypothetical protein